MNYMLKNSDNRLEILDRLFADHHCDNCDHGYNCTGYGEPCHAWVYITEAGKLLKENRGGLSRETEEELLRWSAKEIMERRNGYSQRT
jgi:hypothetical protein